MRVGELLRYGDRVLRDAGISEPTTDVFFLLGHVVKKSRTALLLAAEEDVSDADAAQFRVLVARRVKREPLAYILGEREFWSLPFTVTSDVLIPRPETEFLLEMVLKAVVERPLSSGKIVDLCCGSGVIAVVLARELHRQILAVDISEKALAITQRNAAQHDVAEQVIPLCADLCSSFASKKSFALVVTNPPYVSSTALAGEMQPEVVRYEPRLALDGGVEGMQYIRQIRRVLPSLLVSGGQVFMEIGWDQGAAVRKLFLGDIPGEESRFTTVEILQDYAGCDRVLHAVIE